MILGSMFTLGGIGVLLTGLAADRIGLTAALQANAVLCALGAVLGVVLWAREGPGNRRRLNGEGALLPVENADPFSAGSAARPGSG
jgi:hypothetical protein